MKIFGRNAVSKCSMLLLASILTVSGALADSLSPKDAYLKYRTALSAAQKIGDLQSMLSEKVNQDINSTPAEMKPGMFELMKMMTPPSVQVLSEEVKGDNARLTLAGKTELANSTASEKTTGMVTLVKEDGSWKIAKEAWDSKIEQH